MRISLRGASRVIAAAALAVLVIEPASSLASERVPQSGRTLGGQIVVLHSDDFAGHTARESFGMQQADGTTVQIDASELGDLSQNATNTTANAAPTGDRKIAIVLLNFTNDTSQPWTTSSVASAVFGAGSSVAAYYQDVSYGSTTLSGDVFDWVTVPYDNSSCLYSTWSTAAQSAAHVDVSQYANVFYAFPRTSCQWSGLSTIGGKYSWINGAMTVRTVGHELGHDLGVHHASTLNCTSNGVRVALSATCTSVEYGDPFSIMGTGINDLTNLERAQIGWLPDVQTITAGGYYSLAPSEITAQPRLLRVARGDGTYLYLEYRQPHGTYDNFDPTAPVVHGVTIRLAPDISSRVQSKLIDTTPGTATFTDAPLAVGRTFTDPATGVTITTTAVSASGATVAIAWPGDKQSSPTPTTTPTPSATTTPSPSPSAAATPTPLATPPPSATAPPDPTQTPSATPTPVTTPQPQLSAPAPLRAVRTWGRRVAVRWSASFGAVAGYRVVRNGTILGRVQTLSFIDRVPAGVRRATYFVRAFDRYGHLGPRSTFTLRLP